MGRTGVSRSRLLGCVSTFTDSYADKYPGFNTDTNTNTERHAGGMIPAVRRPTMHVPQSAVCVYAHRMNRETAVHRL